MVFPLNWSVWPIALIAFGRSFDGQCAEGDENWDNRFGAIPGANGCVTAIASVGQSVYVGGWFTVAGGVVASNIARWDGTNWYALGEGIAAASVQDYREVVRAIAADDQGTVYVGGRFTAAGDAQVTNGIAKWDGTRWHALASPVDELKLNEVRAIALQGTNVYAGGEGIARWDGSRWQSLGLMNGRVVCLAVAGDNLYAGGYGWELDSPLFRGVARWDGTTWHQMDEGLTRPIDQAVITALAVDGTNVYAVGGFDRSGATALPGVARWDGQRWSPLIGSDGLPVSVNGSAVAAQGGRVFIGGAFQIPSIRDGLVLWESDGTTVLDERPWRGYFERSLALIAANGWLYAGGKFTDHSGKVGLNVAAWDGQSWRPLSSGTNNGIYGNLSNLAVNDQGVFVGGVSAAGDVLVNNIARWDGANWHSVGAGVDGEVSALAANGRNVYAGVVVWNESHSAIISNYLAQWDGNNWTTLAYASGVVRDLSFTGNSIYVAGDFQTIDGVQVNGFARWTGSEWQAANPIEGEGWRSDTILGALVLSDTNIYVSTFSGGDVVTNLVHWDGVRWAVSATSQRDWVDGISVLPYIRTIVSDGYDMYVGGDFNSINDTRIDKVARWNGRRWIGVGEATATGISSVSALQFVGTDLYAVGGFSKLGGASTANCARWDGTLWRPLGSGLNGPVGRMAACGREVFMIGAFSKAGAKTSIGIARWVAPKTAPALQVVQADAQTVTLAFPTAEDVSYAIERRDFLETGNWATTATKQGDGKRNLFSDTHGPSGQRFYRLRAD